MEDFKIQLHGLLLIDKEPGISSFDVIRKLKKVLPKWQKIGHAGTLDPFATGLLIILLGKATKLNQEIQKFHKIYLVEGEFGYETDTNDPTGKIIKTADRKEISRENLTKVLPKFRGKIQQIPPAYSAKNIGGKRAYALAREGKTPELKACEVEIYKLELSNFIHPKATFSIDCSSGTYVRKLVSDIAAEMGSCATATSLRRTAIGKYTAEEALLSTEIPDMEVRQIAERVIPIPTFRIQAAQQ
jgi:tRNA pseudouridine55 synthase